MRQPLVLLLLLSLLSLLSLSTAIDSIRYSSLVEDTRTSLLLLQSKEKEGSRDAATNKLKKITKKIKKKLTPEPEKATTKEEMEATANSETGAATGSSETGAATGGGNAATGMNEKEKEKEKENDGIILISQELIISGLSRAVAESSKKSLTYAIATSIVVDVETVEIDSINEVPVQVSVLK